jgi:uncharacterized protein YeaO (DUF488 family)
MSARATAASRLHTKNVRDAPSSDDGERILVDRLWPRGVSKERAQLSEWLRDLAPSDELRQWFGHDPRRWRGFVSRYRHELRERGELETLHALRQRAKREPITLVFGASDREHNQAVALVQIAEGADR